MSFPCHSLVIVTSNVKFGVDLSTNRTEDRHTRNSDRSMVTLPSLSWFHLWNPCWGSHWSKRVFRSTVLYFITAPRMTSNQPLQRLN